MTGHTRLPCGQGLRALSIQPSRLLDPSEARRCMCGEPNTTGLCCYQHGLCPRELRVNLEQENYEVPTVGLLGPFGGTFSCYERSERGARDLIRRRIAAYYDGYPYEIFYETCTKESLGWFAYVTVKRLPKQRTFGNWL